MEGKWERISSDFKNRKLYICRACGEHVIKVYEEEETKEKLCEKCYGIECNILEKVYWMIHKAPKKARPF